MTTSAPPPRRPNALGVHSLNRFVFSVPDARTPPSTSTAAFGLDVRRDGDRLDLRTHGHRALLGQRARQRRSRRSCST